MQGLLIHLSFELDGLGLCFFGRFGLLAYLTHWVHSVIQGPPFADASLLTVEAVPAGILHQVVNLRC